MRRNIEIPSRSGLPLGTMADAGVPWQVIAAAAVPVTGGIAWLANKAWHLVEAHSERRTKAVEQIAPAIEGFRDKVMQNSAQLTERIVDELRDVEKNVVKAVEDARDQTLEAIAIEDRIEQVAARAPFPSQPDVEQTVRTAALVTEGDGRSLAVVSTRRGPRSRRSGQ